MVNPQKLSQSVTAAATGKQAESPGLAAQAPPAVPISAVESARYTLDQLESLRKIAARQGQNVLAYLLELAQAEARMLVRDTPGP